MSVALTTAAPIATLFDPHASFLGEGALWHPLRQELFWFDILACTLHAKKMGAERREWQFAEPVSAAGWVDETTLLIASVSGLIRFDLASGDIAMVAEFPLGPVATRSNDGRADRQGGFWVGTMGRSAETGAGAIYRFYRGELRRLHEAVTIPNAICFSADGATAHFADTREGLVWRQPLDPETGWPAGDPEIYLDLRADALGPDGAVIDAAGDFWNAQWGAGRVACYSPDGVLKRTVDVPAAHTSCPAFGGPDLSTLIVTTAQEGLSENELAASPEAGQTFMVEAGVRGLEEPRVVL